MAEASQKFTAGPLTFTVRHELWDGNIQDHADQGVVDRRDGGCRRQSDDPVAVQLLRHSKKAMTTGRKIPI